MRTISRVLTLFTLVIANSLSADQLLSSKTEESQIVPVSATAQQVPVYTQCIPQPAGKTVDVRVQAEFTNDLGFNVGVGHTIEVKNYLGPNAIGRPVSTYTLIPATMTNVTPDMHHMVTINSGLENVRPDPSYRTKCYTLKVWAVSNHGNGALRIEPGYGHLTIALRAQ